MRLNDFDRDLELEEEYAARYGLELPHETREREHDEELARRDRLASRAPHDHMFLAYTDRPAGRERREASDETRVRALLRPSTGNVTPAPQVCPVDEVA